MFVSDALAATGAPGAPTAMDSFISFLPMVLIIIVFYFFLIRPQQQARKRHTELLSNLKRGDVVVTSGGIIGKIKSVADDEVRLELAPNVDVRVVRSTIADVRSKTDPAPANDSKPSE
jgi:preprotein translocase subunit YajC